jgi:hypothetical protein
VAASYREHVGGEQTAREAVVGRCFGVARRRSVLRCWVLRVDAVAVAVDARCFGAGLRRQTLRCQALVAGIGTLVVGERRSRVLVVERWLLVAGGV